MKEPIIGKTDWPIAKGEAGQVSVWSSPVYASDAHDTGEDVTAYSELVDVPANRWVFVAWAPPHLRPADMPDVEWAIRSAQMTEEDWEATT